VGKRRVQQKQVRRQVRQVKPKLPQQPVSERQQKRQRERYVAAGGMLQGYAPDFVLRIGYISAAVAVACIAVMALLLLFLPYGLPVRIVAALAWVLPIVLLASFVAPGFRLAWKDRKDEPRLIQGQLMGASEVSTSLGLGMLMVQTRGGVEQFLVPPEKLAKVPGNQVQVMLNVTPRLRHVRSVGVMGQRMVPRAQPPVPEALNRIRLLPIATPVALAAAAIVGDDVVAFMPIPVDVVHAAAALVTGAVLGGGTYLVSFFLQKRLQAQLQAMVPGGLS
jgi:uncharacterized membrane protein